MEVGTIWYRTSISIASIRVERRINMPYLGYGYRYFDPTYISYYRYYYYHGHFSKANSTFNKYTRVRSLSE